MRFRFPMSRIRAASFRSAPRFPAVRVSSSTIPARSRAISSASPARIWGSVRIRSPHSGRAPRRPRSLKPLRLPTRRPKQHQQRRLHPHGERRRRDRHWVRSRRRATMSRAYWDRPRQAAPRRHRPLPLHLPLLQARSRRRKPEPLHRREEQRLPPPRLHPHSSSKENGALSRPHPIRSDQVR